MLRLIIHLLKNMRKCVFGVAFSMRSQLESILTATTRFSVCKKLLMRMVAFKPGLYINAYSAESVVLGQKFLNWDSNLPFNSLTLNSPCYFAYRQPRQLNRIESLLLLRESSLVGVKGAFTGGATWIYTCMHVSLLRVFYIPRPIVNVRKRIFFHFKIMHFGGFLFLRETDSLLRTVLVYTKVAFHRLNRINVVGSATIL